MLNEMTAPQFTEWMAFYMLEPFGYRANLHGHAIVASSVYNVNRGKKSDHVFEPEEFMPQEQHRRMDGGQIFERFKQMLNLKKDNQ